MKEVEILVEVESSKVEALQKLEKFNFIGCKETIDYYFYDPKRKDLQPDKEGHLSACLRLRKKAAKNFLAYKVDNFNNSGKWIHSDEHEVEVSDFDITLKIINHLGFQTLVQIDNKKHTFLTDEFEIVLEEVKDLGLFLEVEALHVEDNADLEATNKKIKSFIDSLGIKVKEELNLGKPELMLRKITAKKHF